MFRATMCPSSGADDCVMLWSRVGMCRGCRKVVKSGWQVVCPCVDALPINRTWQPPCNHGTYQHETIKSRSRQLLMMGTWLPETCWATIRREIKNTKVTYIWFFLSTLNYDACSTTHQIGIGIICWPWEPSMWTVINSSLHHDSFQCADGYYF